MLRRFILLSPLLIAAGLWPIGALGQSRTELVGSWEGSIRMQGTDQAVTLVIEDDDGELTGVIDIPDQDAVLRRVASIQIRDQYFSFEVEGAAGAPAFDGAIAPDGNGLSGNFVLEGRIYRFELARRAVRDASTDAPTLNGAWVGTLDAGGLTLEIRLNVPAEPGGRVVMSIGVPGRRPSSTRSTPSRSRGARFGWASKCWARSTSRNWPGTEPQCLEPGDKGTHGSSSRSGDRTRNLSKANERCRFQMADHQWSVVNLRSQIISKLKIDQ